MKDLSAEFLSEADKEKIINAVKQVEKTTSGEIMPVVVSSSYHYPVSNILGAMILGMIAALTAVFILRNQYLWLFLSVYMVSFAVFHELVRAILPLKKLFISEKEMNEEVREGAVNAFFSKGLFNTRDKSGVLIYISVFERKVWILADSGINKIVQPDTWENLTGVIIDGIKKKEQGDAIVKAVIMAGDILKTHFPAREDDTDELDNLVIDK